jgi:hypothetical protein
MHDWQRPSFPARLLRPLLSRISTNDMADASEFSSVPSIRARRRLIFQHECLGFERYQGVSLEQMISTMAAQNIAKGVVKMEGCYKNAEGRTDNE